MLREVKNNMTAFYIVMFILFIILTAIYIFLYVRFNIVTKKKINFVRSKLTVEDQKVIDQYHKDIRVTMRELFLGVDYGTNRKK